MVRKCEPIFVNISRSTGDAKLTRKLILLLPLVSFLAIGSIYIQLASSLGGSELSCSKPFLNLHINGKKVNASNQIGQRILRCN